MKLSVIIPVFNEEKTIGPVLARVSSLPVKKEILVIDDGSNDQTKKLLGRLSQKYDFKLLVHAQNQGKGAAIKTGVMKAQGDYLVIQDADLEYQPEQILSLLKTAVDQKAAVVFGSRFRGQIKKMPLIFWLGNVFLTAWVNLLFNTRLTDVATGAKLFQADLLKEITWKSTGFEFEMEITARILKKEIRILEIPVSFSSNQFRPRRKKGWREGWRAFWLIFKIRFLI